MDERVKEPSTYAGAGLVGLGIAQIIEGLSRPEMLDFEEGTQIAGTVQGASEALSLGDIGTAMFLLITGGIAIARKELKF